MAQKGRANGTCARFCWIAGARWKATSARESATAARIAPKEVLDDGAHSDAALQHGIDFALIQMKAETLARIDAALARLDAGMYGDCLDCESEISGQRLRALPFAVRCIACEEKREQQARARRLAQGQALALFAPM